MFTGVHRCNKCQTVGQEELHTLINLKENLGRKCLLIMSSLMTTLLGLSPSPPKKK